MSEIVNEKIDILSLHLTELETEILNISESKFRAKQIWNWLHTKKASKFSEMSNISEQLKEKLEKYFCIKSLFVQKRLVSGIDDTVKYLYALSDHEKIETVLMKYHHGNSLCISTQVGCKMKCSFCASGISGFVRNLTPSEMLLQIYETERNSLQSVDSLVLMGIGEPLDNFDNVVKFLQILSDKNGRNMSLRHVSLSTCGLADRIEQLAEFEFGLTLSISLHAADDITREMLMPINKRYNISRLLSSCRIYFNKTGRRISIEFALIEGINDDKETAEKLIKLLKPYGMHINLIPVNSVNESGYKKSNYADSFLKILTDNNVNATIRRTLGADIEAACGQLRCDNI